MSTLKSIGGILLAVLVLAGCSSPTEDDRESSTAQTSESGATPTTSSSTESGEQKLESTGSPQDTLDRYLQVAELSCLRALEVGVVEESIDGAVQLIMVPKALSIEGYSAVYIEQLGNGQNFVQLLYEASVFSSCSDYFDLELAKEAGQEFDYIEIEEGQSGSMYLVTREFDSEPYTMRYGVLDGLIVSSTRVSDTPIQLNITYGTDETHLKTLEAAVDDLLQN